MPVITSNRTPAARVRDRIKWISFCAIQDARGVRDIAARPTMLLQHPEWLRHRTARTMSLRAPWWPYDAAEWVGARLHPGDRVFEYGGGGSTLWLHDHGAKVTCVEHDVRWHFDLAAKVPEDVRLLLVESQAEGAVTSAVIPGFFDDYVAAVDREPDESLDLVIVTAGPASTAPCGPCRR